MKTLFNLIVCAVLLSFLPATEPGEIKGTILEGATNSGIPYATVAALNEHGPVLTTTSDSNGHYSLKPLQAGSYSVKVTSVGYSPVMVTGVVVTAGNISLSDIKLNKGIQLSEVQIVSYSVPLIDKSAPSVQKTISYEEIQQAPVRDVNSISSTSGKVYQNDAEGDLNIQGSRSNSTSYYVDGIKVRGVGKADKKYKKAKYTAPHTLNNIADVANEQYDNIVENEYKDVRAYPLSTFSIDADAASYSNVRRFLIQNSLPPKDAVRVEELINYFSYDYPQPAGEDPFAIYTEVSSCPWNEKHRLVHIGLQGKNIPVENLPASNLVFLMDVSGSMDEPNKLPLLKKSFSLLVEQLRSKDRVAIVTYAGNAGLLLPSTSGNDKEEIFETIDNLRAGGSTAGGEGIQLAYKVAKENFIKSGNNRVILATDGDFNVGISSDDELTKLIEGKRDEGIFLTVLGFGMGNYKDSKMEKLADKGNGNYAYIDNIMEANKVLVKEMGATLNTIAKDVKLQIEFNPTKVKGYRLIGYENRLLANEDFNDDKKDAGELGAGHAVTALYEIIPAGNDEKTNGVDSLKYQKTQVNNNGAVSNELLTVKFRYKEPMGNTSKLIVHPLVDNQVAVATTSDNFRFSASVAEFGLLLRDSKFKGTSDYAEALKLARGAKGKDTEGYRAEFTRLIETAKLLSKGTVAVEK